MPLDIQSIRDQFPVLAREINGYPLAYLDNAASAQKPTAVMDAMNCLLYTSPSPRDRTRSRMPSSA